MLLLLLFTGLSSKAIASLPRMPFSKLNERTMDMFHVSAEERKMAYEMERSSWKGIMKKGALKLSGEEHVLGFTYKV